MLAALAAGGCDESRIERVPVNGTVRIDGHPLTGGTVRFVPESGRPLSGNIQPDGKFELASESFNQVRERGAPRGEYRIQVSASKIVNDQVVEWKVPQRYADFRTSGLRMAIDEPQDNLSIDLTWKEPEPGERKSDPAIATQAGAKNGEPAGATARAVAEGSQP